MSVAILKLTRAAQADRMLRLCSDLASAVAANDLPRISALDHALRSCVMAMLGEGAPKDDADMAALTLALSTLTAAVQGLRAAQRRGRHDGEIRALYLAPKAAGE
jgi:hypothetical protein